MPKISAGFWSTFPGLSKSPELKRTGLFALIATLGTWFGFANPVLQVPLLALILPLCLTYTALRADTPGKAAGTGFWISAPAYAAAMYWVAIPVRYFGGLPWGLALPCPVLLGMYMAGYAAVFTAAVQWGSRRFEPLLLGIYAGLVWGVLELIRAHLLTGFPWLTTASAFVPWPVFIQGAAFVGEYGVGALLVACAVWICTAGRSLVAPACALAVLTGLMVIGMHSLTAGVPAGERTARISLIQGNIDQSLKWDRTFQQATIDKYLELSRREVINNTPDLLIWPETALPFYFQDRSILSKQITDFIQDVGVPLLTGAPAYAYLDPGPGATPSMYNRAYLLDAEGEITDRYDKEHLVPFGEYVPYTQFLPLPDDIAGLVGNFSAGSDPSPLRTSSLALGILICYEAIFPELARSRVAAGANLLINISNDAWFGRSSAPAQHLQSSAMRAVEQNRYLIRATNAGISAIVDNHGRIIEATPLFKDRTLFSDRVPLLTATTPYHRHSGTIRYAMGIMLGAVFLAGKLCPSGVSRYTKACSPTHKN